MKKIWISTLLLSFVFVAVIVLPIDDSKTQAVTKTDNVDSLITVTISIVGDLMCHSTQYNYARVESDSFDFRPVYREVKNFLSSADLAIGNLETVTAGKAEVYSGYPFFNTPDDYIVALKDAGFDLLVTANNHALDQGEKGVFRTIEQILKNNLNYVGTFTSENDRDSIRILCLKGIRIAVLSYTYGTNGIPKPKSKDYIVNLIDFDLIEKDIKSAREKEADLVLVYYHFGEEYQRLPNQFQRDVVNNTIEFGADIIIGSHPHVIQPTEYYKTYGARLDTGFVIYSLGNFISNQRWRYSDTGLILNIELTKNYTTNSIFISDVNFIPTWVFRGNTDPGKEFIILPSQKFNDSTYYFLSNSERLKIKEAFEDTKSILTKFNDRIRLYDLL
ncbi:MAG: CapA family protein [Ignavibacteriaceae bacterium]|nr:CapA family protein [Ignavibacteriaceae bacterium]